ncbi:hypothetical protein C8R45DRAFT_1001833 [Mycena sanguinolenta]|nr:hypothetical protein C8R45DRAFT_1001833 [Mycena sanguinolenta]
MLSELEALLSEQNVRFCANVSAATARLPQFQGRGPEDTVDSGVAYVAYKMLRDLATADGEVIWRHFGDIIAEWPGSTSAQNIAEALVHERQWLQSFRQNAAADEEKVFHKVRKAIACVRLEYVPSNAISAFGKYISEDVDDDDLARTLTMHHRSEQGIDTIFILPSLPRMEKLIKSGLLSSPRPTSDDIWDVVVLATATSIIRELRHMTGMLIHETTYFDPPMIRGFFPDGSEHNIQGPAGDWHQISRYGAVLSPALVSPTNIGKLGSTDVVLIGHLNGSPHPRFMFASCASDLAERVWDGSFVQLTSPFFGVDTTYLVVGYVLGLDDLELPGSCPTPQPSARK